MHKIHSFLLATFAFSLLTAQAAMSCSCDKITVPSKPDDIGAETGLAFSHTPAYRREFNGAVTGARNFCTRYLAEHPGEKNLAIVFDIDETLLDNRSEVYRHPNRNWEDFELWIMESKAPELRGTANFLRWARRNGFAIFLVTGRPEADRKPTIINLVKVQLPYDGLYFREKHGMGIPAEEYKSAVRASIEEMGFKIVENIGDQYSDLAGGHSLDCQKLPNKMYFIK